MYEVSRDICLDGRYIMCGVIKIWCSINSIHYPLSLSQNIVDWCNNNLSENWCYYYSIENYFREEFSVKSEICAFESETDAMAFKLRWT
jgi:hypothetical protein